MLYCSLTETDRIISYEDVKKNLFAVFDRLGKRKRILAIPPDYTRRYSMAGKLTELSWEYFGGSVIDILPALGTHTPMTSQQIEKMFGSIPRHLFREHKWNSDITTIGTIPSEFVKKISKGAVEYDISVDINRLLFEGGHDLVISFGQVVPHEVIGMANYNKNIFIGTGGAEIINKSHFLGAAYGMENIMGKADTPVRSVLDYASDNFTCNLPIVYVLTVISDDPEHGQQLRGLFIGDDKECFYKACKLSKELNTNYIDSPMEKVVVYLDPEEYRSTWLGNKSIYRTRMAIANGGELIVLAPGVREFGEDREIDRLIRKYGYKGTLQTLNAVDRNKDLNKNLCAAAHLIHGSSEGRFRITYSPGHLTEKEVTETGFNYENIDNMLEKYNPYKLKDGYNIDSEGNRFYFISNPSLGLWSYLNKR